MWLALQLFLRVITWSKYAINIYSHKYRDIECLSNTLEEEESIEYTQHNDLSLGLVKIGIQLDLAK